MNVNRIGKTVGGGKGNSKMKPTKIVKNVKRRVLEGS
jgi:hypothetical protein